jgi:hypothetical protein
MEGLEVRDVEKKEVKKKEAESLKLKVDREEARKEEKGNALTARTDERRFRAKRLFRKAGEEEPARPGAADENGEIADKGRRSFLRHALWKPAGVMELSDSCCELNGSRLRLLVHPSLTLRGRYYCPAVEARVMVKGYEGEPRHEGTIYKNPNNGSSDAGDVKRSKGPEDFGHHKPG